MRVLSNAPKVRSIRNTASVAAVALTAECGNRHRSVRGRAAGVRRRSGRSDSNTVNRRATCVQTAPLAPVMLLTRRRGRCKARCIERRARSHP